MLVQYQIEMNRDCKLYIVFNGGCGIFPVEKLASDNN